MLEPTRILKEIEKFRQESVILVDTRINNTDSMVQPVTSENNNSALDMESLDEMLRKVIN